MTARQNSRPRPARPLPTYRTPSHAYLAVAKGICLSDGPFTARELETVCGVRAERIQLTLAFWRSCGLVERVPGRGMYRATQVATSAARAWRTGDVQGRAAVRHVLKTEWFARSVKSRLAAGPGLRTGVITKLMRLAQVGDEYRRDVEMLVDLMVAVGMLSAQSDGYLSWNGHTPAPAAVPAQAAPPTNRPPAEAGSVPSDTARAKPPLPAQKPGAGAGPDKCAVRQIPSPVASADDSGVEDLVALLSQPVRLADLARLSPEELLSLHGHLAGLSATATKLRSRPTPDP
ncbi:hypothetical protein ACE1OC_23940 [Streptomyces sp. DSM 116496]|uniref:hypothetical protein n=1 Tax=Streptomyces stoeckheimensis TaxID=3344656 RepID=UPI0038B236C1